MGAKMEDWRQKMIAGITENEPKRRLPAEWEEQDGVLIAWPHEKTDWAPWLPEVESVFRKIAREIARFETVVIVARAKDEVREKLRGDGVLPERLRVYEVEFNDTWTRDYGPLTVYRSGRPLLLDFAFNGWGLKFPADLDNQVTRELWRRKAFQGVPLRTVGMVLEGGSIESDGEGTILTTSRCLLSPNRNPHLTRKKIERKLAKWLGAQRVLWLDYGGLAGDDTDGHIDTLARLCPDGCIAYVACEDREDEHYVELAAMRRQLMDFRRPDGKRYQLVPLPLPQPCRDEHGRRLPATYANFLVINGAVLLPVYGDPADEAAAAAIAGLFPGREVVPVDCRPLIRQGGSLHCATMQLPKGTLRFQEDTCRL